MTTTAPTTTYAEMSDADLDALAESYLRILDDFTRSLALLELAHRIPEAQALQASRTAFNRTLDGLVAELVKRGMA